MNRGCGGCFGGFFNRGGTSSTGTEGDGRGPSISAADSSSSTGSSVRKTSQQHASNCEAAAASEKRPAPLDVKGFTPKPDKTYQSLGVLQTLFGDLMPVKSHMRQAYFDLCNTIDDAVAFNSSKEPKELLKYKSFIEENAGNNFFKRVVYTLRSIENEFGFNFDKLKPKSSKDLSGFKYCLVQDFASLEGILQKASKEVDEDYGQFWQGSKTSPVSAKAIDPNLETKYQDRQKNPFGILFEESVAFSVCDEAKPGASTFETEIGKVVLSGDEVGSGNYGSVFDTRVKCESGEYIDAVIKIYNQVAVPSASVLHSFVHAFRAAEGFYQLGIGPKILYAGYGRVTGDQGESDQLYLVMEKIEGENLGKVSEAYREKVKSGTVSADATKQALQHIVEFGEAVKLAHDNKLMHRDLRPENCIVTSDGKIKFVDCDANIAVNSAGTPKTGNLTTHLYAGSGMLFSQDYDLDDENYALLPAVLGMGYHTTTGQSFTDFIENNRIAHNGCIEYLAEYRHDEEEVGFVGWLKEQGFDGFNHFSEDQKKIVNILADQLLPHFEYSDLEENAGGIESYLNENCIARIKKSASYKSLGALLEAIKGKI